MAGNMNREELIKASKDMDPSELVRQLNLETANFIDQLPKNQNQNLWSREEWDKQLQDHPLFMTSAPAEDAVMSPLVEAIQQLKYDPDENTPEELARAYKDDGNENFKNKKYRWAVDSYTKGLEAKCTDQELVAQLLTNRAASQYHIGNYEKSLKDALAAKSMKPSHLKALERGALCCLKLRKLSECLKWCEEGLNVSPENKCLQELKVKALEEKKIQDRNKRRALALSEKNKKDLEITQKAIEGRNIKLASESLDFPDAEIMCPGGFSRVHLDKDNKLVWPVLIMYPEYGTSDYIKEFHEESILLDHLRIMFDKNDLPGWDEDKKYIPENLLIYFLDNEYLVPVKNTEIIKNILCHKRFKVLDGTPCFFVTVMESSYDKIFRNKYKVVE